MSSLNYSWRKIRNFRNSSLRRQEIFEIRFYVVVVLEKRKKFSKFDFTSSRNFRNSILHRQEIFEIRFYLIIELGKKEEILEIRFYIVKKFSIE